MPYLFGITCGLKVTLYEVVRDTVLIIIPASDISRKANMRALKLLQFTENRQLEMMNQRFIIQKDNLEKQFELELRVSS